MNVKPVLMNTEMVKAILEGRKTTTCRLIKPQPENKVCHYMGYQTDYWGVEEETADGTRCIKLKQPYQPGDILYVRETYDKLPVRPDGTWRGESTTFYYKADGDLRPTHWKGNWKPSIHMPKEAARLFLKVKEVNAHRLHDLLSCGSELAKEGLPSDLAYDYEAAGLYFKKLWDSTIKTSEHSVYSFDVNPWVWVIEFERCEKPEIT